MNSKTVLYWITRNTAVRCISGSGVSGRSTFVFFENGTHHTLDLLYVEVRTSVKNQRLALDSEQELSHVIYKAYGLITPMTETTTSRTHAGDISFLRAVAGMTSPPQTPQ